MSSPCDVFDKSPSRITPSNGGQVVSIVSFILCVIVPIIMVRWVYLFKINQLQYERLRKRKIIYPIISSCGVLCQLFGNSLHIAMDYPCFMKVLLLYFVVPLLTMPMPIRLLDHYNRNILGRRLINLLRRKAEYYRNEEYPDTLSPSARPTQVDVVAPVSNPGASSRGSKVLTSPRQTDMFNRNGSLFFQNPIHLQAALQQNSSPSLSSQMADIVRLQFLTSWKMTLILVLSMLTPYVGLILYEFLTKPYLNPQLQCRACSTSTIQAASIVISGIVFVSLGCGLGYILRKHPDPFENMKEIRLTCYGGGIAALGFVCDYLITGIEIYFRFGWVTLLGCVIIVYVQTAYQVRICKLREAPLQIRKSKDGGVNHDQLTKIVYDDDSKIQEEEEEEKDLEKQQKDEHEIVMKAIQDAKGEALTKSSLAKLLTYEIIAQTFQEFLIAEFSVENIRMYEECRDFRRNFDVNYAQSRINHIIETYVADNAVVQVNFSHKLRLELIENSNQLTSCTREFFQVSDSELLGMMLGSYMRFTKSKLFERLIAIEGNGFSKSNNKVSPVFQS